MSKNHYIFVDYENVHTVDLSVVGSDNVFFTLLLGASQTKLDVALVEKLIRHATSVELVRLTSSGKNALDFAIAYYLGRAVVNDPGASFHIISRDTGFNPLVSHLRGRSLNIHRHADYSTLPFVRSSGEKTSTPDDLFTRVLARLTRNANSRPRRKKTLITHIRGMAGKNATDQSIERIIQRLVAEGHIAIDENEKVTYKL